MKSYTYTPYGVCSHKIRFKLEDGKLHDVKFDGGCSGNLRAIGKLLEGADAQATVDTLLGNQCGMRPTSCADQLARAIQSVTVSEHE